METRAKLCYRNLSNLKLSIINGVRAYPGFTIYFHKIDALS